jgi:hypothetical protein
MTWGRESLAESRGVAMERTTMNWQGAIMTKNLKSSAKAAAFAALLAVSAGSYAHAADMPVKAPPAAKPVPFFFVNDTSVSFTYFFQATDPGVAGSSGTVPGGIAGTGMTTYRAQGAIDHFDVWEYGTNLIHVEFNQYGPQDPSLGQTGAQGAREFFGFSRSTLSINDLTHSKVASSWAFKDIGFELGGTAGVEDNFLDEHTTQGVAGLNFDLNLPGTVLVGVLAYKEFTRNEFDACGPGAGTFGVATPAACAAGFGPFSGDRYFNWTWRIESFISEKVPFLPDSFPVSFINILNVTGPKGTGISTGNWLATCGTGAFLSPSTCLRDTETKTEVFEDARLTLDTSKVFWGKPGIWDTYVGYRYWYNKFGTDHNAPLFAGGTNVFGGAFGAPGGSIESTAYVGTTYHFK